MFGLPKYFDNLHIGISAITGEPRIVSIKEGKNCSDKYKVIPDEEWKSCIVGWFSMFKPQNSFIQITKDWGYCIGGKALNKKHLIQVLRELADSLEKEL